jgi:toxin ParE1/3/4
VSAYQVSFTSEAADDLQAIFDHIAASSGEERATSVVGGLVETCRSLDLFPYRGRPRDDLSPGLRVIAHRGWASIAYTVAGLRVTIEGVLWRGRDVSAVFGRRT